MESNPARVYLMERTRLDPSTHALAPAVYAGSRGGAKQTVLTRSIAGSSVRRSGSYPSLARASGSKPRMVVRGVTEG